MKQCPRCGNTYTDDTLRFCLEDGTPLAAGDEQPTVVRSGGDDPHRTERLPSNVTQAAHNAMRVDIPTAQQQAAPPTMQTRSGSSPLLKILLAIFALGFLVVLGAGILGAVFYFASGKNVAIADTPTPTPTFSPTPTSTETSSDDEDFGEALKELEKKLNEMSNSNVKVESGDTTPTYGKTARVNSPNDGFLAMRNLPSADIGDRIAKIPHGTTIKIVTCAQQTVTIAGRSGHWCMVSYNEQVGWVFDAWLDY